MGSFWQRSVACSGLLVWCLAATWLAAQEPAQAPGKAEPAVEVPPALTHYHGREIAQTMHFTGAPWLVRESRQREEDCARMLAALKLQPGQTVCDLGCGNGFYTLQMARAVGPMGAVWAVDIQPEMLRYLEDRAGKSRLKNVKLVRGSLIDPFLPENTQDLILLVDVYHEFSHPEHMLQAIRKSLKEKGRLVLVEFRAEDDEVPIKPLHKMTKAQVRKELEANGFKLAEEFDKLPWQHMLFFERDPDWTGPPKASPDTK